MKKFVLIALIAILSKLSFVYADNLKRCEGGNGSVTVNVRLLGQLEDLAGKTIYRNVPIKNETEFSKEYMNEQYELFSYNENIMELKDSNKKSIILERSLWDDGNWKEWVARQNIEANAHDFKIGDKVKTNKEYNKNFRVNVTGRIICLQIGIPYNVVAILDSGKMLDTDWLEKDNEIFTAAKIDVEWYVGMEVCDVIEGRGVVVNISRKKNDRYPVKVNIKERNSSINNSYTLEGAYILGQVCRLYPTEVQRVVFDFDKLFPEK